MTSNSTCHMYHDYDNYMHEPSTPELLFNATIYVISCL